MTKKHESLELRKVGKTTPNVLTQEAGMEHDRAETGHAHTNQICTSTLPPKPPQNEEFHGREGFSCRKSQENAGPMKH